jgi:hypothetical protein
MSTPWTELRNTLEQALPALRALSDEEASQPYAPGKWTRKETIGHLIDSATNNHGRFVRAQLQDAMVFTGYAQDDWVNVQRYRDAGWGALVELWHGLNQQLAHVMENATVDALQRPRMEHNLHEVAFRSVPADAPPTLAWFMEDYVEHLRHHVRQVLPQGEV